MRIRELRESRNMKQYELAEKLHVDKSTMCLYESGQRKFPALRIPELAEALGCEISELFMEKGGEA